MVTKNTSKNLQAKEKGRVDIGKLQLNKETVKDLTSGEVKDIKGGCMWTVFPKKPPEQSANCPPPPTTVGPLQ